MAKAAMFDPEHNTVAFICPACKGKHHLNIEPLNGRPAWGFNGNYDSPTFTPSIMVRTGKYCSPEWFAELPEGDEKEFHDKNSIQCHSWVTDGHIRYEADSTHGHAGQTLEIPEYQ